jgi:hypothetical protein
LFLFLLPVFGRGNRAQKKPKTFCETILQKQNLADSLRWLEKIFAFAINLTASSIPAR